MAEATPAFIADAAMRIDDPRLRRRAFGRRAAAAGLALALEAGVFAIVWYGRGLTPAPQQQEIPVEIVVEPPKPPPPPPPQPQAKPEEMEKPATDAPRQGKADHDDEHVSEKETPAKAAPPPPAPSPSPEATKPPAEAAAPELPQAPQAEAPAATPSPEPTQAPPPKPSVADVLPKTFDAVPDVDFGGQAIKSPVTGGNAKSTYLSTLYGLIVPRLHVPPIARSYGRPLKGQIGFQVDGRGRLVARFIVEGSGSMEFDEAAMQAVGSASHEFPAPPHHEPIGMTFTYSVE